MLLCSQCTTCKCEIHLFQNKQSVIFSYNTRIIYHINPSQQNVPQNDTLSTFRWTVNNWWITNNYITTWKYYLYQIESWAPIAITWIWEKISHCSDKNCRVHEVTLLKWSPIAPPWWLRYDCCCILQEVQYTCQWRNGWGGKCRLVLMGCIRMLVSPADKIERLTKIDRDRRKVVMYMIYTLLT